MLDGNLLADLDGTIEGARQRRVLDDGHVVFLGDFRFISAYLLGRPDVGE